MNITKINIKYGTLGDIEVFQFCPTDTSWDDDKVNEAFDKAVKELNRVYAYGRFATKDAVLALFRTFGFMAVKEGDNE